MFNFIASLCSRGVWFESRFVGNLNKKTGFVASRPNCADRCLGLLPTEDKLIVTLENVPSIVEKR